MKAVNYLLAIHLLVLRYFFQCTITMVCDTCIPANLFSVKCVRFFLSTESEFPKIYRWLPKIAENFKSLPKIAEGFQRLPKIFRQLPTITEGVKRFLMTSKQGRQRFPKDFQPISSIITGNPLMPNSDL